MSSSSKSSYWLTFKIFLSSMFCIQNSNTFLALLSKLLCGATISKSFPGGSNGKESACNVEDLGSIPGSRRSPGEGNGYLLQYSGLENSMDRGAWQLPVHGVVKSQIGLND